MDYDTLEIIRYTAESNPGSFPFTLACLDRRDDIIEAVEELGVQHDSLSSESHINLAVALENCDIMLETVFERESGAFIHSEEREVALIS